MVQILQVTLREAQFKSKIPAGSKAVVKVVFGESEKNFPNPRVIKGDICNFYGQRMSLSNNALEPIEKALLNITVLDGKNSTQFGDVEIDIQKIKQHKDGTRVKLDLENDNFYITLQTLVSSYAGASDIDIRSQKSDTLLSPLRPKSTIGTSVKTKQASQEEVLSHTPLQKNSGNLTDRESKTQVKRDAQKQASKTFQLNKKTSLNNIAPKMMDEDRKSEISQRPMKNSIQRNKEDRQTRQSRQPSVTQSAKPEDIGNKSSQNITRKVQNTNKQQKRPTTPRAEKKVRTEVQTKKEQEHQSGSKSLLSQFGSKDYIQFAIVSAIAFITGIIMKKI